MILVTGGTGFLGSTVLRRLQTRGEKAIGVSLSTGTDLSDLQNVRAAFQKIKPQYVIHCASLAGGIQFGAKYPADAFSKNMIMTLNVLEVCREFGIQKFIHPVSNCVYPAESTIFRESEIWDGPLHPSIEGYGAARKALITATQGYRRQYGLESLNLVLPNMYGPGDHLEEDKSHALGGLLLKILHAKKMKLPKVTVWGTGAPIREWLFIEDGADALIRGLDISSQSDLYNVGSGEYLSIKEIAEILAQEIGYSGEFYYDLTKPDGAKHKQMEFSKFQKEFSWTAKVTLREGIKRTILSLEPQREAEITL